MEAGLVENFKNADKQTKEKNEQPVPFDLTQLKVKMNAKSNRKDGSPLHSNRSTAVEKEVSQNDAYARQTFLIIKNLQIRLSIERETKAYGQNGLPAFVKLR